jgi:hypothetical protein
MEEIFVIEASQVLTTVQAGVQPPTWQVLRASSGYFARNALIYGLVALAALGGLYWFLFLNDGTVYYWKLLAFIPLDAWYWIDIGIILVVLIACTAGCIGSLRNLGTAGHQVLVLMPEGVIIHQGKKEPEVIDYAEVAGSDLTYKRDDEGDVTFTLKQASGTTSIELDRRFGKADALAQSIMQAHQAYRNWLLQQQSQYPS